MTRNFANREARGEKAALQLVAAREMADATRVEDDRDLAANVGGPFG